MATWPSGKAKVCNTYITSSNLVVASLKPLIFKGFFVVRMYVNVCRYFFAENKVFVQPFLQSLRLIDNKKK